MSDKRTLYPTTNVLCPEVQRKWSWVVIRRADDAFASQSTGALLRLTLRSESKSEHPKKCALKFLLQVSRMTWDVTWSCCDWTNQQMTRVTFRLERKRSAWFSVMVDSMTAFTETSTCEFDTSCLKQPTTKHNLMKLIQALVEIWKANSSINFVV